MDLYYLKKAVAGMSAAAITLTQVGVAFAAYSDVPEGVLYEDAVNNFVAAGYLDDTQPRFRGSELANRAEFVKLVVELNGGILSTPPAVASFDDVDTSAWYYGYFEEAGKEGWVRGDGNCYGSHPCYARPAANINRAEAVALITRSFALEGSGAAPQFVDNPSGQWYTDVVQTAADHCVLQGDGSTGRVRPSDNMNRAEMIVMLDRVDQGLTYGVDCGTDGPGGSAMITDVVATSATTIEVEFNVDLDQASAEDADNYSVTPDVAVNSAVLFGDDVVELTLGQTLDPNRDYTLTVEDLGTSGGSDFSDSMGFVGYSPIVLGDGVLEASLSASNPVGDTVPSGAVGVVLLSVDLTASCDDSVVVEDVTILHEGFGDEANIDGIYAAIDGARVTRKRTIDSEDQTADLRFSSPLVIDPCETVTVDVVADFATTSVASEEHNLVLELASDLVTNAQNVDGNFPVRGETFRMAAVTSGTVTVEFRSVTPTQIEVGDNAAVIGKFEVSVNSVEDQTLYSMTLEQDSSASDGDFTNIAIRRTDGTILTNTVSSSVGDFVTLVFDPPFTVLEGDKITLEVIADIVGGAGDNLQMKFEESSDVFAVGSLYGYGVNGQLYGSQITISTSTTASTVSIDAGEFTIGIDGPPTQDYTRDDNDAVLANIEFQTGGEKIDVKDLFILIEAETSTGQILSNDQSTSTESDTVVEVLEDVEIRNKATGRTVSAVTVSGGGGDGTLGTATGSYQIYRFDDFIIHGDEVWEFRVDFIDNGAAEHPLSGDQFRIHICGEPKNELDSSNSLVDNTDGCDFGGFIASSETYQMDIEGLSTGDSVGDVRPKGNISGNFHEIANASLTIAVQSLNTTDSSVENAKDITLLRFEARAGEAEDILLTKAVFEASGGGNLQNAQNYTLWVDTDGDGQVDTKLEEGVANQSSAVSFTDLAGGGFVIPAEETVIFEVHADVASSLTTSTLEIRFDTGATTMVEAEELDDGSNLSGISTTGGGAAVTLPAGATTTDITVTYVASTVWTLSSQGNLYVTQDSTPTRSRQLLGGALSEPVLRVQFRAENEKVDVTDIQITSSGSTATSVESLELYLEGASTPFATANDAGCATNALSVNPGNGYETVQSFCANMETQQFLVPEGEELDVLVRARMKADTAGGTSNQALAFFIDEYPSSSTGAVRARGYESSNDLDPNTDGDASADGEVFVGRDSAATTNLDIVGNDNVSVLSKIASITDANPDSGTNPSISTGITPFGQFKVTAAANSNTNNGPNKVTLSGIVFNVNATNVEMDDVFSIYNKADSTVKKTCTAYESTGTTSVVAIASGTLLVSCEGLAADSVNTEIDPGSSATFVLEGEVTDSNTSTNSTLQAELQKFDDKTRTTFGVTAGATISHIEWNDDDSAGSDPEFTWVEYPETVVKSTSYKNS